MYIFVLRRGGNAWRVSILYFSFVHAYQRTVLTYCVPIVKSSERFLWALAFNDGGYIPSAAWQRPSKHLRER